MYRSLIKPLYDRMIAGLLLLLLSPFMLMIALLVRVKLGHPVLFRQQRPGYKAEAFILLKFRTMNDKYDNEGNLLADGQRLAAFGAWLRSTSLDELPELFNVLKGEMSLVGPRPLLMEYLPLYSLEQARRHEVKPGITGWAQINGRNDISWQDKFKLDVWYVDHVSFVLDLKILLHTSWKVIRKEGISQEGLATAEKYKGNSNAHGH